MGFGLALLGALGAVPRAARAQARPTAAGNEIVIEGQLGVLTRAQLDRVLGPVVPSLERCYTSHLAERSYLSGTLELRVRIAADGAVRWVVPTINTLADADTVECMANLLRPLRFECPRGGETETSLPVQLDGGDEVRPATEWPAARLAPVLARRRAALQQCLRGARGRFSLTVYAAPRGGAVASAGVAATEPDDRAAAAMACVLREAQSWRLPDPGSWYAKATVTLGG